MSKKSPKRDARDPRRGDQTWTDRAEDFEARPLREGFKWSLGTTFTVIGVVLIAIVGVFAFNVGTSDVKGRGDALRQKNSGINRIQQQEMFEQRKAAFDAFPTKIAVAQDAVDRAAKTDAAYDDQLRQTELTGLVQQCISTARDYNAATRKYTARDFRAADLPARLDASACQPTEG